MEDFESAAVRHFEDADRLFIAGRFDNAGHLFGIAGECAVKAVCRAEGGDHPTKHFATAGPKDLRFHALPFLIGRRGPGIQNILPGLFQGWAIEQRYHRTGKTTQAQAITWQSDARKVLDALQGV